MALGLLSFSVQSDDQEGNIGHRRAVLVRLSQPQVSPDDPVLQHRLLSGEIQYRSASGDGEFRSPFPVDLISRCRFGLHREVGPEGQTVRSRLTGPVFPGDEHRRCFPLFTEDAVGHHIVLCSAVHRDLRSRYRCAGIQVGLFEPDTSPVRFLRYPKQIGLRLHPGPCFIRQFCLHRCPVLGHFHKDLPCLHRVSSRRFHLGDLQGSERHVSPVVKRKKIGSFHLVFRRVLDLSIVIGLKHPASEGRSGPVLIVIIIVAVSCPGHGAVSLGRPFPGLRVHLVDPEHHRVAHGLIGEGHRLLIPRFQRDGPDLCAEQISLSRLRLGYGIGPRFQLQFSGPPHRVRGQSPDGVSRLVFHRELCPGKGVHSVSGCASRVGRDLGYRDRSCRRLGRSLIRSDQKRLMGSVSVGIHIGHLILIHVFVPVRVSIGKGKAPCYHPVDGGPGGCRKSGSESASEHEVQRVGTVLRVYRSVCSRTHVVGADPCREEGDGVCLQLILHPQFPVPHDELVVVRPVPVVLGLTVMSDPRQGSLCPGSAASGAVIQIGAGCAVRDPRRLCVDSGHHGFGGAPAGGGYEPSAPQFLRLEEVHAPVTIHHRVAGIGVVCLSQ